MKISARNFGTVHSALGFSVFRFFRKLGESSDDCSENFSFSRNARMSDINKKLSYRMSNVYS